MTKLTRNLDGNEDALAPAFIWRDISGYTEKTNQTGENAVAGWLAFDATCAFCVRGVARTRAILERRHIQPVPLQTDWVRKQLGLAEGEQTDRMWLLLPDGRHLGGADALIELARRVGWARPAAWIATIPGMRNLMQRGYLWIARRRHCLGGACSLTPPSTKTKSPAATQPPRLRDMLPLLALPATTILLAGDLPAWLFMWLLATAIFAGCKWLMYQRARTTGLQATWPRTLAYFVAWPGLDARAVFDITRKPAPPTATEWTQAIGKTLLGGAILWGVTRLVPTDASMLAGWCAMVGIIFLLHFGLFHLITLAWRAAGIDAPLMMRNPIASQSLSEFWGKRWNRDFRVLAHEIIFKPTHRRLGVMGAAFAVFLFSGLVHVLVISLPARGGFGLPTAYFLLQFAGIWFEGSPMGRRLGLGHGWRGWAFALAITAGPMFWLFHPPFVHEVILPFAQAIGAR